MCLRSRPPFLFLFFQTRRYGSLALYPSCFIHDCYLCPSAISLTHARPRTLRKPLPKKYQRGVGFGYNASTMLPAPVQWSNPQSPCRRCLPLSDPSLCRPSPGTKAWGEQAAPSRRPCLSGRERVLRRAQRPRRDKQQLDKTHII